MQSRIVGTTMPVLEFTLDSNEAIISEAGELSWMSSSIQLTTHTQLGGGPGRVWLLSLPMPTPAHALVPYTPKFE